MTIRTNPYEVALDAYLRDLQIPYLAIDEQRRSLYGAGSLKNVDFVVSPPEGESSFLVDVKGRKFPSGRQNRYWKNWATTDDLDSLAHWQRLMGPRFSGLLVFAYQVAGEVSPVPTSLLYPFRGEIYGFVGIRLDMYTAWSKTISPKWKTVAIPTTTFRQLAQPLAALLLDESAALPSEATPTLQTA